MSYDLVVWKAPPVTDFDEFHARFDRFYTGDESAFDPSPDVAAFHDELLSLHPALESLPEEAFDRPGVSPWAMTPERSDRVVAMNMSWSSGEEMGVLIARLAIKHHLMLYDPQGPDIFPPDGAALRPRPDSESREGANGAIGPIGPIVALALGSGMVLFGLTSTATGAWALVGLGFVFVAFAVLAFLPWIRRR